MASLRFPIIRFNHSSPNFNSRKPQLLKTRVNERNHQIRSYFNDISCVCKDGKLQEAVDILLELDSRNFPFGPDIYGDLLQGCAYERNLSVGQQIHARIIKKGESLAENEYIETKLVVFYAKLDLFEVAVSLFHRLGEKNVFSWAAIIGLYCRRGFLENALLGFCEMVVNGVEADNFVVPNVLKACGGLLLIGFGKGVHGYVVKMGLEGCVYVASSLVDMYGKCGAVQDARKVFDCMCERNVVAWNSVIVSYAQNGMYEEAVQVFSDMRTEGIQPTAITMVSFLSASANLCALEEGRQGHAISILSGLNVDSIMGTSLVNLYSKAGSIEEAEKVFSSMPKKDVVAWNLMISCYVQHKKIEKAINLCGDMLLEGLKFDCVTMTSIVAAAGDIQNLKLGKEAHCQCIRNNFVLDVAVVSSIVDMYAKCDRINDARRVFDLARDKDLVLWNTLLAAYAELGMTGETLKLFYQMQLESVPPNVVSWNSVILGFLRNGKVNEAMVASSEMQSLGIEANLITHTILISGLVQNGLVDEAIVVFQEMQEKGFKPNNISIVGALSAFKDGASLQFGRAIHGYVLRHEMCMDVLLATSMVDMYAKCGNISHARRVFDTIYIKELPLYNAMISGYALHGCTFEGLALFRQLQKEGIKPDSITFTSVLSLCKHSGLVDEGLKIFTEMIKKHNMIPSMEHYGCVVSLLSQSGTLHKALQLVLRMPFKPDSHILGSLLASCREHKETELAKYLAKYLTKIEPNNSGNYVALSNAYAAAGKWDEVSELRTLMREKGIKKSPGCSWVQIGSERHVFVANDRSKSQTEEIYATLALLRTEMQAMGYETMIDATET